MDCSPPGYSVHGIFQARVLECFAIPSSRGFSQPKDQTWVSWISHKLCVITCMCIYTHTHLLQSYLTQCDSIDCSPPCSSVHGDVPGKNTGMGFHALLQGIFLTQGPNLPLLCVPDWQADSSPLVPPGKPIYAHIGVDRGTDQTSRSVGCLSII